MQNLRAPRGPNTTRRRSLYCGPLTQTAVFRHSFRSRCRGTDRETSSKASLWSGLCVVNIHFWYLCEEKSHIPYFQTKPQDKRGNIQRALEDEYRHQEGTGTPCKELQGTFQHLWAKVGQGERNRCDRKDIS